MKITIISRTVSWEVNELINSASKLGVEVNTITALRFNNITAVTKECGDVVVYRSSFLDKPDKVAFLERLQSKNKVVVNLAYITQPYVPFKSYQQVMVKGNKDIKGIETFKFHKFEKLQEMIGKEINYPFIVKPDHGAMGTGIILISNPEDLKQLEAVVLSEFIIQNFIANNGDYRVIVAFGKPVGVLKRVAKEGSFLNNIAQGGVGYSIVEEHLRNRLFKIAAKVAAKFDLQICGVDIIEDKEGNLYFMEVNTAPQFQGFKNTTGIDVSELIISLISQYYKAANTNSINELSELVYDSMAKSNISLGKNRFHYLSRISLWLGDQEHLNQIATLEENYKSALDKKLSNINKPSLNTDLDIENSEGDSRKPYFKKYPLLSKVIPVLFGTLFMESIYNKDVRQEILSKLDLNQLVTTYKALYEDTEAIKYLSTHAVNFFYLTRNLLGAEEFAKQGLTIEEEKFLKIAQNEYDLNNSDDLKNLIYLLTHCIIGESRFYTTKVNNENYNLMAKELEKVLIDHYFEIKLDNKFEFLVCSAILDFSVNENLRKMIDSEAINSISDIGLFLVDKYNTNKGGKDFISSEHRNVLFIMANKAFNPA